MHIWKTERKCAGLLESVNAPLKKNQFLVKRDRLKNDHARDDESIKRDRLENDHARDDERHPENVDLLNVAVINEKFGNDPIQYHSLSKITKISFVFKYKIGFNLGIIWYHLVPLILNSCKKKWTSYYSSLHYFFYKISRM